MKLPLAPAFVAVALAAGLAHGETEPAHLAGRENKTPGPAGPPGYVNITDEDRSMNNAVGHAQHSLGFFIAVLKARKADDSGFEVSKAFVDGSTVEHLWVDDVTFDGAQFRGRINNRPLSVHNVRLGEQVAVAPREVSDWMFVKKGVLMGGYTTRVLYSRLTPEERAAFDKQAKFKIEASKGVSH